MAYSPSEKYPGAVDVDPDYQGGKFRDNNPSTTNNGSPLKAIDRNELLARDEAIMNDAGFEYNGLPDTPQDSQLFKAYKASLGNGANLLSNHNFLIQTPDDSQPLPSATPTSYPPGYQIFSGVFANETTGITNLTYIDGRVSFSGGDLYFAVPNAGGVKRVTDFVASVADFDGKPRTRGVSFALVGDEYRVTVTTDALEDAGAVLTPLGSVKFEQGSVATGHFVISSLSLGELTNYTVSTVADLKSASWVAGNVVNTKSYHSSMLTGSNPPVGGGSYIIKTSAQYGGVPDGNVDHYVGGGTSLIAQLIRRGTTIEVEQCGIIPNSQSDALFNLTTINEVIANVIGSGGVIEAIYKQYFFEGVLILKNGVSLLGMDGVTYRDNHDGQTRFTFTTDTDGVSIDGFSVFRNALKNIKIDNTLAVGTSTSKGLNYSANGGGTGTRGLGGILENVTIQNFKDGSILGSEGDFNWNQEIKNLKIYRCQTSLSIDGSNGVSQIDGLHIDPAGGFSSGLVGVRFLNGNGFTISNYGIENNNIGLSFEGNENNDRLYLNDGYMEGNLTTDFDFIANCSGQIYSNKLRCAYFSGGVKPACFSAASNAAVSGTFTDTTIRGDQTGADGLSRVTSFVSSVTEIGFDGLNLQADCEIWQDFGSGKSPTFVRMINRDKAGNSFSLYRDVLSPTRMFAKTERVSTVAPVASDTFTVSLPSGTDLDLKYTGATVRGLSPGVWSEWIWDGSSFIATP